MTTLLLDKEYVPVRFLSERDAIRLFYLQKAEILTTHEGLSVWKASHKLINATEFPSPATLRLLYVTVPRKNFKRKFSRKVIFSRDSWTCQYCGNIVPASTISIDHIIPVSRGGKSEWLNCVTACRSCNSRKSAHSLEEVNMSLLKLPSVPTLKHFWHVNNVEIDVWHPDWSFFL